MQDAEQLCRTRRIPGPLHAIAERVLGGRDPNRNAPYSAHANFSTRCARASGHEYNACASIARRRLRPRTYDRPNIGVLVSKPIDDERAVEAEISLRREQRGGGRRWEHSAACIRNQIHPSAQACDPTGSYKLAQDPWFKVRVNNYWTGCNELPKRRVGPEQAEHGSPRFGLIDRHVHIL